MADTPNDYSSGTDSGGLITEQVKQGTQQVVQQTQQAAGQAMEQAKGQAQGMLQSRKSQATDSLNSVAQALRQTGESLRAQNQEPVANMTDSVAQRIEGVSNYFDQRDIGQLMTEAERYARQNPIVVLGGAFLLGVAAARFLKSSTQPMGGQDSYGQYGGSYRSPYANTPNGGYYNRDYGSVASDFNAGYSSYDTSDISTYGATSEFAPTEGFGRSGTLTSDTPDLSTDALDVTNTTSRWETGDGPSSRSR